MHLAILTQYYPPEIGAPQARLSELAANFIKRGHQVTVLTAMPNYPRGVIQEGYGGLWRTEEREGARLIRGFIYPTQRADFAHRLTNYFSFVISSSMLGSLLLERPDCLLVESPPLFLGLSALWLSWVKGARLIFNVSDLWPESAARLGLLSKESRAYRLSERLEAFLYRHAWLVTGQSKSILSDIAERFPQCRTYHLSNGVDTQRFRPERRNAATRAELNGDGGCVALYAGLHGLAQGLDQVLDSAEVLKSSEGLKFVLIGDGPEKAKLMREAERRSIKNVSFLEPHPASEIPSLLASADIALVTLKTYLPGAVPSKLYEAMASGRPVVLMAEGEAADIVRQHNAGLTVRPGDGMGMVNALQTLQADPSLRVRLGENGRRAAEQIFDRARIAAQFIDYLEANLSPAAGDSSGLR